MPNGTEIRAVVRQAKRRTFASLLLTRRKQRGVCQTVSYDVQAARLIVTIGKCFRPSWKRTSRVSFAPGYLTPMPKVLHTANHVATCREVRDRGWQLANCRLMVDGLFRSHLSNCLR